MNKPKAIIAASAVFISATLSGALFLSQEKTNTARFSEVYTWDCEYPEVKPEALTITCADGGQYIDGISWQTWGSTGAQGMGTYHVNDCDPNCAEGNFTSASVNIELSKLTQYKGKNYLGSMVFSTLSQENLPESEQNFYEWDLMEFAMEISQ